MNVRTRFFISIVLISTMTGGCMVSSPFRKENHTHIREMVDGNTTFALSLYNQLKTGEANLCFSPLSLSMALSMTYEGARGNTAKEMAAVMHLPRDQETVRHASRTLLKHIHSLGKQGDIVVHMANRIWPREGYAFLSDYWDTLKTYYLSDIETVDYAHPLEAATDINRWVGEKTANRIEDLVRPGALTPTTRLVVTNAVYFQGNWQTAFDQARTITAPFTTPSGRIVPVPMMHLKGDFNYTENDRLRALALPYAGNTLSMILLLPKRAPDFRYLENALSTANLKTCFSKLAGQKVNVAIPRFTMDAGINVSHLLTNMGMEDAFTKKADFSGMDGSKKLYLDSVLHKAHIDVNEKGTEAAAASAVIVAQKTSVERIPIFRADHPFIFLIRENTRGSILFLGRVMNPLGT